MEEKVKQTPGKIVLSIIMGIISVAWLYPIFMILINSLKTERSISTSTIFKLPTAESFNGIKNFAEALTSQGFAQAFGYSLVITVTSLVLILICCSMCAWYITRVDSILSKVVYYLFVFSMVVPFQMLMFTLSSTADRLNLDTPFKICIIYLGFGAGLAVFMFTGFMKTIPVELEEAAMIDGCDPLMTFFRIDLPVLKPTIISVAILEAMWLWNDYLLPYLVLDRKKYTTIPILIQYFKGSYGSVQMGPMMACILMTILPVIILYLAAQKYIIEGVVAGAVKG
ncbi:MAG: carbohydrate ABC transporter permease [Lachnospiraceae bacterium]|nr:carbohydrate ABC transporter permease [Lachnospiraceae bacterium]